MANKIAMTLESEIRGMYAEIVEYRGSFGDAIDHGSYNPYEVIRHTDLTPFERTGVSIAILHYLQCAIENGTYIDAVASESRRLKPVIAEGLLDHQPLVRRAAEAFFESEATFADALNQVFEQLVCC